MLTSSLIEARATRVIFGLGVASVLSACSADMSRMSYYGPQNGGSNDVMTGSVSNQPNQVRVESQELPPDPHYQTQTYAAAPAPAYGAPQQVYVAPKPAYPQNTYTYGQPAQLPAPARPQPVYHVAATPPQAVPRTRLGWSAANGTMVTVAAGQTPASIARQYGIPEDALLQVNGLPANARLLPGARIVIPSYNAAALVQHGGEGPVISPVSQAEVPQQLAELPRRTEQSTAVTVPPPRPHPWSPVGQQQAMVQVPVMQGQQQGQVMRVPVAQVPLLTMPGKPHPVRTTVAPDNPQLATGSIPQTRTVAVAGAYVVKPGESLGSIAKGFHVHIRDLALLNGMQSSYNVRIGQRLIIPAVGAAVGAGKPVAAIVPPPGARPVVVVASKPVPGVKQTRPTEIITQSVAPVRVVTVPVAQPMPQAVQPQTVMANDAPPDATQGVSFRWPVKGRMVSTYGNKGNGERNDGVNIEAPAGTVVRAAESGEVVYAGKLGGYGNIVLIKHTNGYVSAYAYTDEMLVHRGDKVVRGQSIATVGTSGTADSPQLHFEIRSNNRPIDPVPFLGG